MYTNVYRYLPWYDRPRKVAMVKQVQPQAVANAMADNGYFAVVIDSDVYLLGRREGKYATTEIETLNTIYRVRRTK